MTPMRTPIEPSCFEASTIDFIALADFFEASLLSVFAFLVFVQGVLRGLSALVVKGSLDQDL